MASVVWFARLHSCIPQMHPMSGAPAGQRGDWLFGRIAALPSWGETVLSGTHHAQLARFGLGIKRNPRLFQYPRLDALMVYAQQV